MTWPLFQKTQDPHLTRAISKTSLSSSFNPDLVGPSTLPVQHRPRPHPMLPFASQSPLYSHLFTRNPTCKPFGSLASLIKPVKFTVYNSNKFLKNVALVFALKCIWSYDLYSPVHTNLSSLEMLVLALFALCCCLNIKLVRPVSFVFGTLDVHAKPNSKHVFANEVQISVLQKLILCLTSFWCMWGLIWGYNNAFIPAS